MPGNGTLPCRKPSCQTGNQATSTISQQATGSAGMSLFSGRFERAVDRSGRVIVPAPYRAALVGSTFADIVVLPSPDGRWIIACVSDQYDRLISAFTRNASKRDPGRSLAAQILAHYYPLSIDRKGRIALPNDCLAHARIFKVAFFLGMGDVFRISGTREASMERDSASV